MLGFSIHIPGCALQEVSWVDREELHIFNMVQLFHCTDSLFEGLLYIDGT